jgi:hypothetical protein
MLDHLCETYRNITAVDLEINFEHMRRAWDPQQPVETLFKQIQDCAHYSEAGGVLIGHPQQINVGYAKIFTTGHFMSACRRWNEKLTVEKTWTQFKSHFAAAHCQHKQMQGESAATAGYHSANSAVTHNEDQMDKPTLEHHQIWQHQPQRTEVWWQLSLRQILVLQNSWRTTPPSCGNSRLCSRRNNVKSVTKEASTPHPEITVGLMATKLVALTRASLTNSRNPATKWRPLERITWEVVRPTENDVQGQQL